MLLQGVQEFHLRLVSPSGVSTRSIFLHQISGNHLDGFYRLHAGIPHYSKTGIWRVDGFYVRDRTGNSKTYSESELIALGFNTQLTVGESEGEETPALTFTDNFNRANGNPFGAAAPNDWIAANVGALSGKQPVITSNTLVYALSQQGMIFRPDELLNTRASVKLVSQSGDGGTYLGARFIDDLNGYLCAFETGTFDGIFRMIGGNRSGNLAAGNLSVVPTANDTIRFTVTGTTPTTLLMEILRGGNVVDSITATDSTEALQVAGRNGVGGEWAAITLDDYSLTELTS